eukprot:GHVT01045893.1.p1 GENE.GHVT01045893.1~~GHVT01045893.1.p1  ORF type:complete len:271 (+),score=59.54 GHVT01045893.1:284-1096(+)
MSRDGRRRRGAAASVARGGASSSSEDESQDDSGEEREEGRLENEREPLELPRKGSRRLSRPVSASSRAPVASSFSSRSAAGSSRFQLDGSAPGQKRRRSRVTSSASALSTSSWSSGGGRPGGRKKHRTSPSKLRRLAREFDEYSHRRTNGKTAPKRPAKGRSPSRALATRRHHGDEEESDEEEEETDGGSDQETQRADSDEDEDEDVIQLVSSPDVTPIHNPTRQGLGRRRSLPKGTDAPSLQSERQSTSRAAGGTPATNFDLDEIEISE